MKREFPYVESKKILVALFKEGLSADLKDKAEFILDLHLHEDSFAMNKMTDDDFKNTIALISKENSSIEEVLKSLQLEDTTSKKGMFRVLVRTRLNSTGIGHLTMGTPAIKRTLSPRILNFTDTIDVEKDSESDIISKWLEFALQNNKPTTPAPIKYDDRAVKALKALKKLVDEEGTILVVEDISGRKLSELLNVNEGWCIIVLSVITGLNYLKANNWRDLYNRSFNRDITYSQIDMLIQDCQKNVRGFGYALAGSFFGDLGSPHFVKDDTHVRDGINVIYKGLGTPEQRVKAVIDSAKNVNVHPRVLDKILYFGGSGNLYLIGVKLKKPQRFKEIFLEKLSEI